MDHSTVCKLAVYQQKGTFNELLLQEIKCSMHSLIISLYGFVSFFYIIEPVIKYSVEKIGLTFKVCNR